MANKNIVRTVYKVSDFVSWQRSKSLILSPSFQRRSVWSPAAKSYFVDTVMKGLPVPIIFLRERTDLKTLEPQREVVDGQQRLRTLISFIDPKLLKDFKKGQDDFSVKKSHNPEVAGMTFDKLDEGIRQSILDYQFSVHVLQSDTEDTEILQIFARMNSTGMKLNDQELRNAEYLGVFKQLAYQLAYEQLGKWRGWGVFSETEIARMIEVEETSDLILTMLKGVHGKSQSAIDKLYADHEESFKSGNEVTRRFREVMETIDRTIGVNLKDLAFSKKPLFHTLFSFYYELMYGFGKSMERSTPKHVPSSVVKSIGTASRRIERGALPERLAKVLRGATGNLESRRLRLSFLRRIHKKR